MRGGFFIQIRYFCMIYVNPQVMIKEIEQHRTVRFYKEDPIDEKILREVLFAGTRASTVGNMQLYSIIVTRDKELLSKMAPLHFNQPAATTPPAILTFCADVNRFSRWCELRGAEPAYDNFCWFMNAVTDAMLASQNVSLEAQAHGLGICYLGTTLYNAGEIAGLLELPKGVIPVMAMSLGYPQATPALTDRLPLEAVVHFEKYEDYTPERLNELWESREASDETKKLLVENNLPNLARIFTESRYKKDDNIFFSRKYLEEIKKQGFFNQ